MKTLLLILLFAGAVRGQSLDELGADDGFQSQGYFAGGKWTSLSGLLATNNANGPNLVNGMANFPLTATTAANSPYARATNVAIGTFASSWTILAAGKYGQTNRFSGFNTMYCETSSGGNVSIIVFRFDNSRRLNIFLRDTGNAHSISLTGGSTVSTGAVFSAALVWNASTTRASLYLNGVFTTNSAAVAMGAMSVNQACVGNQITGGGVAPAGDYWNSDLYSVAMFRRVLTADEIATIGGAMAYGDTARP